jgi:3-oxoacyl-(acyl-carrier-protein) synthase
MEREMGREVNSVWLGPDSVITALGCSSEEVLSAIEQGRIGCRETSDPDLWSKPFTAGKIDRDKMPEIPGYTMLERMFLKAVGDVVERSGIDAAADDSLLVIASTKGNIELLSNEGVTDERVFLGEMAARVASFCGFKNTPVVISNACISGVSAMIVASRLIREGLYRNVVVAGGDTLTRFVVTGFEAFRSVSDRVCRPYDEARDGLTLGEGCGAVLLTADAGKAVSPHVEIAGGAIAGDANHISGPSRTGDGLCFAIRDAMDEAGVTAFDVGFVNGHGTGTVYNDEMESRAFALAGLDGVPVNGLKPYFGHTLGAAGVVETIVSAHALRTGTIYGTPGFERMGTPHPLDVSPLHRATDAAVCVKTASGFGGSNAAIVLRKGEGEDKIAADPETLIRKTAAVSITPDGRPFGEMIRERFRALESPDMKFFKMDDLSRLAYVAAGELLGGANLKEKYRSGEIGIVLANRSASLDTDTRHCLQMEENGDEVSPAVFVYTLPNVSAGEVSIRHKIQGESTFFIQPGPEDTFVEDYARMLLRRGYLKAVIFGWCELSGEDFAAEMTLLETE